MGALYSIGEVCQMTGFSVSKLRYYADMGIVIPEKTDARTGYRYYSFDDIRRLETVGYLKAAGLPLNEIAEMMAVESESEREAILAGRRQRVGRQLSALQEKLELLDWLGVNSMNGHAAAQNEQSRNTGYRIAQKAFDSRQVLFAEAKETCGVEQMYREAAALWKKHGIIPGRRPVGYLIDVALFMEEKHLGLEGQFLTGNWEQDISPELSYMFPKGNYICMQAQIFEDERWIRALSRYFIERDIRPRNILAVLKRQNFYNWKASLYEVQILV